MQCSLGVFDLDPSYLAVIQALAGLRRDLEQRSAPDALKRRIRDIGDVERRAAPDAPDLLDVADADRVWVESVYEVLVDMSAERLMTLEACVYEHDRKGYVAFILQCPEHHHSVRTGEEVVAGLAALRDRNGQLCIWPRISRVENGLGMLFVPEREGVGAQTPAAATRWCLSNEAVSLAFDQARRATEQMVIEARPYVQSLGEPSLEDALLESYQALGDRSY